MFGMRKTFEPCIPTRGTEVPAGPDWLHEIKHDGYRLILVRDGARVRLFTRNGHDWTGRYPLIVEAALKNRQTSFVFDGEAVLLGVDGSSDLNGLHSRRHDDEVQLYAFDILALGGEDLRKLPLGLRKANLARLLARRPEGIYVSDFERGEIGPDLFRRLQHGLGRLGFEAPRSSIPLRPVSGLDQSEEPKSSGIGTGQGIVFVSDIYDGARSNIAGS